MKFLHLVVALLLGEALCLASCTQEHGRTIETFHYPNGQLRGAAAQLNGRLDGRSVAYYPNGQVRAASSWVAGQRTGVTRLYDPDGVLRDSSAYRADSLDGPSLQYARTGVPQLRSWYVNGQRRGREVLYDEAGKPAELRVYGAGGQLVYLDRYGPDGRPSGRGMVPLFDTRDTLAWGEKMAGSLSFGYPLTAPATLVVGTLGTDLTAVDRYPLRDTVQVVQQSADGRFYFAYRPAHAGANAMGYKFLQPQRPWDAVPRKDSRSVDHLSGTVPFFVRPRNTAQPAASR
jgi:hypothetical protein